MVGIKEGFRYLVDNHQVLRPTLAKGCYTMFLGALTYMLILVSEEVLMMGSVGLGLLYSARGVGTGIGPVIGRRIFDRERDWVKAMGFCMILIDVFDSRFDDQSGNHVGFCVYCACCIGG